MKTNVGIIGSGQVAKVLAAGFLKNGYEVTMGSRDASKLEEWKKESGPKAHTGSFADAAKAGEIIVLAVAGSGAESALKQTGIDNLSGKTVIDVTNPIAAAPPVNGVLKFFTSLDESLMEKLQKQAPAAHFVKSFSCAGNAFMVDPKFPGGPPTMFICGNNEDAKSDVKHILEQFGWENADMGKAEAARAIEPLCILWCIPGLSRNDWGHAFKFLNL